MAFLTVQQRYYKLALWVVVFGSASHAQVTQTTLNGQNILEGTVNPITLGADSRPFYHFVSLSHSLRVRALAMISSGPNVTIFPQSKQCQL